MDKENAKILPNGKINKQKMTKEKNEKINTLNKKLPKWDLNPPKKFVK